MRALRLVVCLASSLATVLGCTGLAQAGEPASFGGSGLNGSLLVVPGAEWLLGGEQLHAQWVADRANPEAVFARERSRTAYAHLDAGKAGELLRNDFPSAVDSSAGGISELPSGTRITGYLNANTAQLSLPGNQRGIIESAAPIAKLSRSHRFTPIDLTLRQTGGNYVPRTTDVPVLVPRQLSAGVSLPEGVSLTEIDGGGRPVSGAPGALEGSSVVYANTSSATDTFVRPTATGFQMDAALRSFESPQKLFFRVGMPAGAKLRRDGSDGVSVVSGKSTLAVVRPPGAVDAAGMSVPVSMSVHGSTLVLQVDHRSGSYMYPIAVDPEILDPQLAPQGKKLSNWEFLKEPTTGKYAGTATEGTGKEALETKATGEYKVGEVAFWAYQTRGNSKLFEIKTKTDAENTGSNIESFLEFEKPGGLKETNRLLSTPTEEPKYLNKPVTLCAENISKVEECGPNAGIEKNAVHFQQSPTATGSSFSDTMHEGTVSISEPVEHATVGVNTSSPELEGKVIIDSEGKEETVKRKNVFDGGGWLTKSKGAAEFTSEDVGIGVSGAKLEFESTPGKWEVLAESERNYLEKEYQKEFGCKGVQCEAKQKQFWVLESRLPDGEDNIRYRAKDAFAGSESPATELVKKIKVDTTKPRSLTINGLPPGNELAAKPYALTVEATDGSPSISSSGIKSIKFKVDGKDLGTKGGLESETEGKCTAPVGECTARAKWTVEGAELGAGKHQIEIVAVDNAGNEQQSFEPISIHHTTPVGVGPGTVDLQSGEFNLNTTDVSLGSGLTVSRSYSSRSLTKGSEGPLGPQWNLNLGTAATLSEITADHSMILTDGEGGQIVFAYTETTTYESPRGDSNLALTVEENGSKEKTAFYLKDAADGSLTKFTLPTGSKVWVPSLREGPVSSDKVTYTFQTVGGITRPTEEFAPDQAKVECAPKLNPGCRVLKFTYGGGTAAKGEKESEWGSITNDLSSVSYEGYNPVTKAMTTSPIPVADYLYDIKGRLRAEWDPRLTTPLKTIYGYDKEGHVTALNPPGEESWSFTYGTKAGDAGTGRLLKAQRAAASFVVFKGEEAPKEESAKKPTLSGTAVAGTLMSVTRGGVTPLAISYGFQWQECEPVLKCKAILGATNPNYVPTPTNIGKELRVEETATNGGGTTVMLTATSAVVTRANEYPLTLPTEAVTLANGPDGNMWFGTTGFSEAAAIDKITSTGTITETKLPAESHPKALMEGPDKNLWFGEGDGKANGRIGKITTAGVLTEYTMPTKTAIPTELIKGPDGNIWFTNSNTATGGRFGKTTTAGVITEYSLLVSNITASHLVVGPDNNLWCTLSPSVNEVEPAKIAKISTSGAMTIMHSFPTNRVAQSLTVGPDGNLWFTDNEAKGSEHITRVGKITTAGVTTEYTLSKTGTHATTPGPVVVGPDKELWFTYDEENFGVVVKSTVDRVTTEGEITETALPVNTFFPPAPPSLVVLGQKMWFTGRREVESINTSGETSVPYSFVKGTEAEGNREEADPELLTVGPNGNLWFKDYITSEKISSESKTVGRINLTTEGTLSPPENGWTMEYGVPLEGAGAPAQMGLNAETHKPEPERWGQKEEEYPAEATAIIAPDSPQAWPATSYTRATTYYMDEEGRVVNVESPSTGTYGAISTTEYNEENDVVRTLSADNRATALAAGAKSAEEATLLSSFNTYKSKCSKESEFNEERETSVFASRLCETEGPLHSVAYVEGKKHEEALARLHVRYFYDEKVPSEGPNKESFAGVPFNLVTETRSLTEITNSKGGIEREIEPRITVTSYSGQKNLGWKLRAPTSVVRDAQTGGKKLESQTMYEGETGEITETRAPEGLAGNSPHDARIIYYSTGPNAEFTKCGEHQQWAGLVCRTEPAKQPETSGIPNLPVTETTYNIWDEPEKVTESFTFTPHPTSIRTKTNEYDGAGRLTGSETTATETSDEKLPKVTFAYNTTMGALESESTLVGGKTETISSAYNTLGQMVTYTDADGNVMKATYGGPKEDELVEKVTDGSSESKGEEKYSYNATTKQLERMTDSAAGAFTATYDIEGKLRYEMYPNNMCAVYTYNAVGEATRLEYVKASKCPETGTPPVWYSESQSATVRGEVLNRTSTLASESYEYDTLGQLKEVQETPVGEGCSTRIYEYDNESNRKKEISRAPGTGGVCATTGGTEEEHKYDSGNRLMDTGVEYETLGNTIKLPAADAEKNQLTSSFYVDGAVLSQTQNGVTNEYKLDPGGRVRETISGGKEIINHYDGGGESVAWTCEAKEGKCAASSTLTRNIPGIDGALAAVQTNGGTPVLQLHDLQGNIVATAELSTSATKLLSTYNSTEFGVPNAGKTPPPFAWLGAADVEKSFASGIITGGNTSYVPQTAMSLQTDGVEAPGYPVAVAEVTPATFIAEPWNLQGAAREGAEAPGLQAARENEAPRDPPGILTAKEAQEFGKELRGTVNKLEEEESKDYCGGSVNPLACGEQMKKGRELDESLGKWLEECNWQSRNGEWINRNGHSYFMTKVCFVDFGYVKLTYGEIEVQWYSVGIGFSQPWTSHGTQSWYVEDDKQWWNFRNRGFWEPWKL